MAKSVEAVYNHWTDLTQSQYNEIMLDFQKFCEEGSMIIDKNGLAKPFILNEAQIVVTQMLLEEIFAEIPNPVNIFIHKCRQMGITVVMAKLEQYFGTRIKNLRMQHIMPTEEDADDLMEKKFVPIMEGTHPELIPENRKTERYMKFLEFGGVKLGSSLNFSSSEKKSAGRGGTNQVVIEDEQAYYTSVDRLERGLLGTMPKIGRALRVVLSTANGLNHFFDLSKVAKNSSHWKYRFLPWHMLTEYEMEPKGRLKELTSLSEYEVKLCGIFEKEGYPVQTWARKMQWWEYTFQTEAKLDWDHMFENYPSVPEESFAATGKPVLPANVLYEYQEKAVPFEYVELTENPQNGRVEVKVVNLSTIKRYKVPTDRTKYAIWADPADGGEQGDDSAAVIVDLSTMEAVLSIKEKIDQNDFAELLAHLGKIYNTAQIVVERNAGQSCIDWLVNMLKYPNMYIDPLHTTYNKIAYGVYMTRPVKSEAIVRCKFLLNHRYYKDYDSDWLTDGLHFVWTKTPSGLRKAEGTEGYHDDTIMARLIGMATLDMKRWRDYKNDGKD